MSKRDRDNSSYLSRIFIESLSRPVLITDVCEMVDYDGEEKVLQKLGEYRTHLDTCISIIEDDQFVTNYNTEKVREINDFCSNVRCSPCEFLEREAGEILPLYQLRCCFGIGFLFDEKGLPAAIVSMVNDGKEVHLYSIHECIFGDDLMMQIYRLFESVSSWCSRYGTNSQCEDTSFLDIFDYYCSKSKLISFSLEH